MQGGTDEKKALILRRGGRGVVRGPFGVEFGMFFRPDGIIGWLRTNPSAANIDHASVDSHAKASPPPSGPSGLIGAGDVLSGGGGRDESMALGGFDNVLMKFQTFYCSARPAGIPCKCPQDKLASGAE